MDKSRFEKACNSVSYNVYRCLEKGTFVSSLALGGASLAVPSSNMLDGSLKGLALTSLGMFIVLAGSGGISKTKDINEIKELYDEFLENYVKLHKTFDFNSPVQISEMYSFLVHRGYLSKDKKFDFTTNGVLDRVNSVDGVNILTGKGVCRHLASMLTDVLEKDGIEASRLCVYSPEPEVIVKILKEPKYTLEELYDIARSRSLDEETYNLLCRLIREYTIDKGQNIEFKFTQSDDPNPIKRKIGNHSIAFAKDNGLGYYLDPTLCDCYVSDGSSSTLYDGFSFPVEIKVAPSFVLNDAGDVKRLQEDVGKMPSLSREEIIKLRNNTKTICKDNMDVFERFYNENQELYEDISEKVLKLKKK